MSWITEFVELVFPLDVTKLEIEMGFQLKFHHLPERLFKFRNCDTRALQNLRDDTIWLASPSTFNDPYDCHHFIDHQKIMNFSVRNLSPEIRAMLSVDEVTSIEKQLPTAEQPMDVLIDTLMRSEDLDKRDALKAMLIAGRKKQFEELAVGGDFMKAGFHLCSFSARMDSTLMWAHYAQNHQGFCIEYDIKSLPPDDLRSRFMFPVVYQDEVFDATECMLRVDTPEFNSIHLNRAALIKGVDWSYEEEWRLVFANSLLEEPQVCKMPTPKAVYLGSHICSKNEAALKEICTKKGISMFKMKHSRHRFSMTPNVL
jgi:hypothetical protein